jgi:large subunit ribosomal protein LP0
MKNQKKIKNKSLYFEKLSHLFSKYSRVLLVDTTNVGSNQIQKCRKALGAESVMIIGKNTLIRKVLRHQIKKKQDLENLSFFISGNIGLIFSEIDPFKIREILKSNKIPAPAKTGQISQSDVVIPAGQTDIPPEGTCFFQALNIQTKIQKGQIEIQAPIALLKKGQVIGNSESVLLQKLNLVPFSYELKIKQIFDSNSCYDASVLDIKEEDLLKTINQCLFDLKLISTIVCYPEITRLKNSVRKITILLFCLGQRIDYNLGMNLKECKFEQSGFLNKIKEIKPDENVANEQKESSEDMGLNLFD